MGVSHVVSSGACTKGTGTGMGWRDMEEEEEKESKEAISENGEFISKEVLRVARGLPLHFRGVAAPPVQNRLPSDQAVLCRAVPCRVMQYPSAGEVNRGATRMHCWNLRLQGRL